MQGKIRFKVWGSLASFLIFYIAPLQFSWSAVQENEAVENQLKNSIQEAESKLPTLQRWQKKVFQEEVLPQSSKFIRDYQNSQNGLKVVVDFESLKNYLSFYAPLALKNQNPPVLLVYKTDKECQKCGESVPVIRKWVESRLLNRGFQIQIVQPGEVPSNDFANSISALMKKKQAQAAMVVQWTPAPPEDMDTAHADEKRYFARTYLQVKDIVVQNQQKEISDSDSFDLILSKMMTELLIELGGKFAASEVAMPESGNDEILIEAVGMRDYDQYVRVRSALVSALKEVSLSLEDRSFAKHKIVFAVFTQKRKDEIQRLISQLKLESDQDSSLKLGVP